MKNVNYEIENIFRNKQFKYAFDVALNFFNISKKIFDLFMKKYVIDIFVIANNIDMIQFNV